MLSEGIDEITFYCTTPEPVSIKALGFWGAKVPLPHSHFEGEEGLRKNFEFLKRHRDSVGPDYPLMVDCYMSLTADYARTQADNRLDEALTPGREFNQDLITLGVRVAL